MEKSSTDIRIDDLGSRSDRFEADVKDRFDKVDKRFDKLESKVDATNRTIWAGIFIAAMIKILFG
jgi:tetrahydromethanopterin S-methyltransferase subunit G